MVKRAFKRGPKASDVFCAVCGKARLAFTNTTGVCALCQQERRAVPTVPVWDAIQRAQRALHKARARRE